MGVRPCLLLLGRGFCSVAVLRYLQAARHPFLMPLVCRGRQADHPQGPSGRRVLLSWRRSGWGRSTRHDERGRPATVPVCVRCCRPRRRRRRLSLQRLVYAYGGVRPGSTDWVRQTYRQRFGVETSYRQLGEALPRTSTRNPVVRLFLVGVALLLGNVWVWLHYAVLSTPRRGGRRFNLERLRFKALLLMLLHVAEERFGIRDEVPSERPVWGTLNT